ALFQQFTIQNSMDLDDPLLLAAVCLLVLAVAGLLLARVTRGVLPALDGAEVRRNALQQLQVVRQPQQIVGVGPAVESRTTLQLPLACRVQRDGTEAEAWHAHVTEQQKNGTVVLTVYHGLLKSLTEASAAEQAAIGSLHLAA